MHDFAVVGAGIAGLAIAELLQRSGRSVVLLERGERVFSGASADSQGWFHTGALYAPLPNNSFFRILVGNLDDLFDYYAAFPNMNLRVERNIYTSEHDGWFSNCTNFYAYVSPGSPEVPWYMKLPWWLAMQRAQRRLAWFERLDFRRDLSSQVRSIERGVSVQLVRRSGSLGVELGRLSRVLKSRDRTFDGHQIAMDLLRSFLGHGGDLRLRAEVAAVERKGVRTAGSSGGDLVPARHVIVCAGNLTQDLAGVPIRVYRSPMFVVQPAVAAMNFVRVTPIIGETINHLYHKYEEIEYSVIGNALYYRPDDEEARKRTREVVFDRLRRTFPARLDPADVEIYEGIKTEVVGSGQIRNYQYHIIDAENCTVALPGKLTLGFSLAVNICRHFGIEPIRTMAKLAPPERVEGMVERPRHYSIAMRLARRSSEREPSTLAVRP